MSVQLLVYRFPGANIPAKDLRKQFKALSQITEYVSRSKGEVATRQMAPKRTDCLTAVDYLVERASRIVNLTQMKFPEIRGIGFMPGLMAQWGWKAEIVNPQDLKPGDILFLRRLRLTKPDEILIEHVAMTISSDEVFDSSQEINGGSIRPLTELFKHYTGSSLDKDALEKVQDKRSPLPMQPIPRSVTDSDSSVPRLDARPPLLSCNPISHGFLHVPSPLRRPSSIASEDRSPRPSSGSDVDSSGELEAEVSTTSGGLRPSSSDSSTSRSVAIPIRHVRRDSEQLEKGAGGFRVWNGARYPLHSKEILPSSSLPASSPQSPIFDSSLSLSLSSTSPSVAFDSSEAQTPVSVGSPDG